MFDERGLSNDQTYDAVLHGGPRDGEHLDVVGPPPTLHFAMERDIDVVPIDASAALQVVTGERPEAVYTLLAETPELSNPFRVHYTYEGPGVAIDRDSNA